MAFTPVLHLGVQLGAPWNDPWDPALPGKAKDLAAKLIGSAKGDPNCIGYFLDNEFGWGDDWILGIALIGLVAVVLSGSLLAVAAVRRRADVAGAR